MEYRETIGNVVLNTEDYPGRDLYSDGEIEDVLLDIAKNTDPKDFDKVFAAYNEIQRKQGLDLSSFKKKSVMRYTYVVTNYPDYAGEVYVNLLIYRNTVIAGDICSADVNGFVHGFERQ